MSANSILRGLVFVLITVSLVPVSDGNDWCNNHNCGFNEICCNDVCVVGSDCYCTSDDDCSFVQSCCKNKCRNSMDCEGFPCSTDLDCGFMGYTCCQGTCQTDCFVQVAIIAGSVCGGLVFICVVSFIICCVCRRRNTRPRRVITCTATNSTVTTTTGLPQANPPYPVGQVPPPYQQSYPNYPPPQFDQLQTAAAPPPYNSEPARASEHPPSYNEATTRSSGRVYVPQNSYGAAPTPSAPPVERHQRSCSTHEILHWY